MALQKCSECGHEVSTTAAACPNCGARIDVKQAKKSIGIGGRVLIFSALGIAVIVAISHTHSALQNETPTATSAALTNGSQVPVPADPAALKAAYLKKVSTWLSGMHEMKVAATGDSTDAMLLTFQVFNAGARLVIEGSRMDLDKEGASAVQQLRKAAVQRQREAFPIMRRKFGPIARKMLWENDIEASTSGARYTTVTFVGGAFAANRNIATAEEQIEPVLRRLRFKRSAYRWMAGAETNIYTIDSPPDDALVVMAMNGTVIEEVQPMRKKEK